LVVKLYAVAKISQIYCWDIFLKFEPPCRSAGLKIAPRRILWRNEIAPGDLVSYSSRRGAIPNIAIRHPLLWPRHY